MPKKRDYLRVIDAQICEATTAAEKAETAASTHRETIKTLQGVKRDIEKEAGRAVRTNSKARTTVTTAGTLAALDASSRPARESEARIET
jgi:hypothetical protein